MVIIIISVFHPATAPVNLSLYDPTLLKLKDWMLRVGVEDPNINKLVFIALPSASLTHVYTIGPHRADERDGVKVKGVIF
jgi:hypothetical protein